METSKREPQSAGVNSGDFGPQFAVRWSRSGKSLGYSAGRRVGRHLDSLVPPNVFSFGSEKSQCSFFAALEFLNETQVFGSALPAPLRLGDHYWVLTPVPIVLLKPFRPVHEVELSLLGEEMWYLYG